jgi:hypothetical protein
MATKAKELHANQLVRKCDGHRYFGFAHSQLDKKIKGGEIPAPAALTKTGRAKGWFGWQILDWQTDLLAAQIKRSASENKPPIATIARHVRRRRV